MKRLIKKVLKSCYEKTSRVRRPVTARVHKQIVESVGVAVAHRFDELVAEIRVARASADTLAEDTNLVLDSVVREMARLQRHIEILQDIVLEHQESRSELTLAREHD